MSETVQSRIDPVEAVAALRRGQFDECVHEGEELKALPGLLEGCDRFIDVGANVGLYIFHANRVLHGAEIVAIEANPNLRPAIEEAWRSAGADFDHGNQLEIVNCAILDQEGSIDFFLTPNLDDSSMFSGRVAGASKITVVGRPLDSFYKPSKRTFIKMDIEGAEYRVLNSAPRFLGCGHAEFLLELHPFGEAGIKKYPLQVYHLFFRNGYGCRRVFHHYHFSRMDLVQRTALYCIHFPHLVLMWLPNRFPGRLGRAIARVHGLLAKIRRRLFP